MYLSAIYVDVDMPVVVATYVLYVYVFLAFQVSLQKLSTNVRLHASKQSMVRM